MKRTRSLIAVLCLLASLLTVPVTAEEPAVLTTDQISPNVRYSITESNLTGWGLGFCFTLQAKGVTVTSTNLAVLTNATVAYAGETYAISRIGAVVTHLAGVAADDTWMTRETAVGMGQIKDVKISRIYRVEEKACHFAVRLINIPYEQVNTPLHVRPYVEILKDGEKVTLYGATNTASYSDKLLEQTLTLPYYGTDLDGKGRLFVGETAVLDQVLYLEIVDELDEWMTMYNPDSPDTVFYACYDKDGERLTTEEEGCFYIRDLGPSKASDTFAIELPEGTAEVRILGARITYWTNWET